MCLCMRVSKDSKAGLFIYVFFFSFGFSQPIFSLKGFLQAGFFPGGCGIPLNHLFLIVVVVVSLGNVLFVLSSIVKANG